MKDLNFFEYFISKKDKFCKEKRIYYFITIPLCLFIVIYTTHLQIRIRRISKDVAKMEAVLEDNLLTKKMKKIKEKEEEVKEFRIYLEQYRQLDRIISKKSIIDDSLLESITLRRPDGVYFTSISINTDSIELIGYSGDQYSIAVFSNNLKSLEDFKNVFISTITKSSQNYNFVLNINFEDVDGDGENRAHEENNDKEENDQK